MSTYPVTVNVTVPAEIDDLLESQVPDGVNGTYTRQLSAEGMVADVLREKVGKHNPPGFTIKVELTGPDPDDDLAVEQYERTSHLVTLVEQGVPAQVAVLAQRLGLPDEMLVSIARELDAEAEAAESEPSDDEDRDISSILDELFGKGE
jgi:hypothetical protein